GVLELFGRGPVYLGRLRCFRADGVFDDAVSGRDPGGSGPGRQLPGKAAESGSLGGRLLESEPAADPASARRLRPRLLLHQYFHGRPFGVSCRAFEVRTRRARTVASFLLTHMPGASA